MFLPLSFMIGHIYYLIHANIKTYVGIKLNKLSILITCKTETKN